MLLAALPAQSLPDMSPEAAQAFVAEHAHLKMGGESDMGWIGYVFEAPDRILEVAISVHPPMVKPAVQFEFLVAKRVDAAYWQRCQARGEDLILSCMKPLSYEDIWRRDSPVGLAFLRQVYGEAVPQDFQAARFVYHNAHTEVYQGRTYAYVVTHKPDTVYADSEAIQHTLFIYAARHLPTLLYNIRARP